MFVAPTPRCGLPRLVCLFFAALALTTFGAHAQTAAETVYIQAVQASQTQNNALLLYLRLAGIFWIILEWTAALVLWRAYRLLATQLPTLKDIEHGSAH